MANAPILYFCRVGTHSLCGNGPYSPCGCDCHKVSLVDAIYDRTEEASFHYDVVIECGEVFEQTEENYFANERDAQEWAREHQLSEPNRRYVVMGCLIASLETHDKMVANDWRWHQEHCTK